MISEGYDYTHYGHRSDSYVGYYDGSSREGYTFSDLHSRSYSNDWSVSWSEGEVFTLNSVGWTNAYD